MSFPWAGRLFPERLRQRLVYAGLGDKNVAFEWLDKAVMNREGLLVFIRNMPFSDVLETDSRYQELLRRIGLES